MEQRQNTFYSYLGIITMNWKERIVGLIFCLTLLGILMWAMLATQSWAGVTGTAAPQSGANIKPAGELVAKQNNCLSCHRVDMKLVGPAFQDVAKKYTEADREFLVSKIIKGGKGVWGPIPMPPNPVDEQQANQVLTWIFSLKK